MRKVGCLGLLGVMVVILQLICPISSQPSVAENDTQCLQTTYSQVKDSQNSLYTWNFGNTTWGFICNFLGITCWHNDDNKVLSISLPELGLQGEFPYGVKFCGSMTILSLSQNSLTGTIPKDLCKWLPYLVSLDLSQNKFTGSIPAELHNCTYLNVLHLNGNQLTGEIPWQLTRLDRLNDFNVAHNKLSGIIPSFIYHNFTSTSFQNNPGLCGLPLSKTCTAISVNPMVVAAFLLIGTVLIVWILLGLRWMIRRSVKVPLPTSKEPNDWQKYVRERRSVKVSLFEKPIRQMRLADLVAATDDFNEDNIILCQRTGTLYKAKLHDGSLLAVKRLRPCSQSAKDFKCEMKALAHLRHRNLVPLLGYCIVDEEKLLVYKYVARGTLLSCLHGPHGEHNTLDWAKRLKICIGTARGLAWLHHNCDPHVFHRNISSRIIFIDEDYEPRISGFGLARLMDAKDSNCVTISCSAEKADVELVEDFGYDAPEAWRDSSVATLKGDVYSFGILVLEIITELRPRDTMMDEESRKEMTFLEWIYGRFVHDGVDCVEQAIQRYRQTQMRESSDEWKRRLFVAQNDCVVEQVTLEGYRVNHQMAELSDEDISVVAEVTRVAFECVNHNPEDRPSMYEVYKCLTKIGERYSAISHDDEEISLLHNFA